MKRPKLKDKMLKPDLKDKRQNIIDRLNEPNYQERVIMERDGITWDQLKERLKIPLYK